MITKNTDDGPHLLGLCTIVALLHAVAWSTGSTEPSIPIGRRQPTPPPLRYRIWRGFPAEINGPIHWLQRTCRWPQTASLHASVGGGSSTSLTTRPRSGRRLTRERQSLGDRQGERPLVCGTFEWLRQGQTAKPMTVLSGATHQGRAAEQLATAQRERNGLM
jgi:hypothetical protein